MWTKCDVVVAHAQRPECTRLCTALPTLKLIYISTTYSTYKTEIGNSLIPFYHAICARQKWENIESCSILSNFNRVRVLCLHSVEWKCTAMLYGMHFNWTRSTASYSLYIQVNFDELVCSSSCREPPFNGITILKLVVFGNTGNECVLIEYPSHLRRTYSYTYAECWTKNKKPHRDCSQIPLVFFFGRVLGMIVKSVVFASKALLFF